MGRRACEMHGGSFRSMLDVRRVDPRSTRARLCAVGYMPGIEHASSQPPIFPVFAHKK